MEYNNTSDDIIGADSAFLNFAAANFGDAGTESNKDGGVNLRLAIDNLSVNLGNRIAEECEPKNYDEIKKLLLLYNSSCFNSKLTPFIKDDIETLTVDRFNRILNRLGSNTFNPQSLEIVKPLEFADDAGDVDLHQDLNSYVKRILTEYQDVVQELLTSNDQLNNKILAFETVRKNVETVTNLPINEATKEIYGGITHYLQIFYKENELETEFTRFMKAYRRFLIYKKFMGITAAAEPEHKEPLCVVCINEPVNHVFVPCGHTFCGQCTKRLTAVCFICRTEIRQKMRIYFN